MSAARCRPTSTDGPPMRDAGTASADSALAAEHAYADVAISAGLGQAVRLWRCVTGRASHSKPATGDRTTIAATHNQRLSQVASTAVHAIVTTTYATRMAMNPGLGACIEITGPVTIVKHAGGRRTSETPLALPLLGPLLRRAADGPGSRGNPASF